MPEIEVSVVLAVKNEARYIVEAIESIVSQQGVRMEVVVVDDGSTDATFELIRPLAERDARLRVVRNPKAGKCSAFNHGVALAKGRFVCIFAGDDLMPAGSLAARHAMVRDRSDDVPVVGLCKLTTFSADKKFDGTVVPRAAGRGALSGVSPLMNRHVLARVFPVPETLPNEDTWMELAVMYFPGWVVIHSDIIGCRWRVHDGNSINMMMGFDEYNRRISVRLAALPMFLERFGGELAAPERAHLEARVAAERARLGGDILGILRGRAGLVDKLRTLSIASATFYGVRRRLFSLMSGW